MNRTAIANYAPAARRDFIDAVSERAAAFALTASSHDSVGKDGAFAVVNGVSLTAAQAEARNVLAEQMGRRGFGQVVEEAAYTWFNRFVALRYMELQGWLPCGCRVLGSESETGLPAILEHLADIDQDMLPHADLARARELRLDGEKEEELYRLLLVAQCNGLADAMPLLFEKVSDASELLLPAHLLSSDGLIRKLVDAIPEEDWEEVEIVGWIYQYYISERKDRVIGGVVRSEDIPAATQLFTPNWIVRYMVQNTLGREWMAAHPSSGLKAFMPYYVEPAEQAPEVRAQLDAATPKELDPEDITFLDPACGSGHILVEAYNILKLMYEERGYARRDIPRLILERNLFGLDIDPRAAQLAQFALLMRAGKDDRRILGRAPAMVQKDQDDGTEAHILGRAPAMNIVVLQKSDFWGDLHASGNAGLDTLLRALRRSAPQVLTDGRPMQASLVCRPMQGSFPTADAVSREDVVRLLEAFSDADTYGSLIRPSDALKASLPRMRRAAEKALGADLGSRAEAGRFMPFVRQAELLAGRYDCVVANPPYMGGKGLNAKLKAFAQNEYPDSKSDLFAMFMERNLQSANNNGIVGMVTMQSWMFLSSYEKLRSRILGDAALLTMAHIGARGFDSIGGEVVQTTAFTMTPKRVQDYEGSYFRLVDGNSEADKAGLLLEAIRNRDCGWFHTATAEDFAKIPGSPIAYWVSEKVRRIFAEHGKLGDVAEARQGLSTADNNRFLRQWFEVGHARIGFGMESREQAKASGLKWFPCNKGGEFRKWYGNQDYVVNWENDGEELFAFRPKSVIRNPNYHFREGLTWSAISSGAFALRFSPRGFISNAKGPTMFVKEERKVDDILPYMNSCLVTYMLKVMCPTLDFSEGPISRVPYAYIDHGGKNASPLIALARADWDNYETSWDFQTLPLLRPEHRRPTIAGSYASVRAEWRSMTDETRRLEIENNRIFNEAYDLQDEIPSDVPLREITLTCNPWYRYGVDEEACRAQGADVLAAKTAELEDRLLADSMKELIQYAIGCMMGRYSLDVPGIAYAGEGGDGFDEEKYGTFPADGNGILPLLDHYWFEDDVAHRFTEFVRTVWGRETLEENLRFVADRLEPKVDELPEETVRRWLGARYFKEWHLRTYRRRPIYWLFSSGKRKAFECLVYLHRFNRSTLARIRGGYVIPMFDIIDRTIKRLDAEIDDAPSTAKRKELSKEKTSLERKLAELRDFDGRLRHIEAMNIAIDLDDGVRMNYGKFGDLLAEAKAVTGGKED